MLLVIAHHPPERVAFGVAIRAGVGTGLRQGEELVCVGLTPFARLEDAGLQPEAAVDGGRQHRERPAGTIEAFLIRQPIDNGGDRRRETP